MDTPTRFYSIIARCSFVIASLIVSGVQGVGAQNQNVKSEAFSTVTAHAQKAQAFKIATFNASLHRNKKGELISELESGQSAQASLIAEIIQRNAPDILVLQEFDYDAGGRGIKAFQTKFLSHSQNGAESIQYPFVYQPPVNTGVPTGQDLSRNGRKDGPDDAHGFGKYEGQYGFVVLSKYPINQKKIRTFQMFLWKDMPNAHLPKVPGNTAEPWYSPKALKILRLSSKNHVDVPITIGKKTIHVLVAHPTPPVFDGPENRNGLRNHDEIRLLADYINPNKGAYLIDDQGQKGGLDSSESFVIAGDMNADPIDGESTQRAIHQILDQPRVHPDSALGSKVPKSLGGRENNMKPTHKNDPKYDTAGWGLRVDYVLPSSDFEILGSGVFWPPKSHPLYYLVQYEPGQPTSSDHRLVWVELRSL